MIYSLESKTVLALINPMEQLYMSLNMWFIYSY